MLVLSVMYDRWNSFSPSWMSCWFFSFLSFLIQWDLINEWKVFVCFFFDDILLSTGFVCTKCSGLTCNLFFFRLHCPPSPIWKKRRRSKKKNALPNLYEFSLHNTDTNSKLFRVSVYCVCVKNTQSYTGNKIIISFLLQHE